MGGASWGLTWVESVFRRNGSSYWEDQVRRESSGRGRLEGADDGRPRRAESRAGGRLGESGPHPLSRPGRVLHRRGPWRVSGVVGLQSVELPRAAAVVIQRASLQSHVVGRPGVHAVPRAVDGVLLRLVPVLVAPTAPAPAIRAHVPRVTAVEVVDVLPCGAAHSAWVTWDRRVRGRRADRALGRRPRRVVDVSDRVMFRHVCVVHTHEVQVVLAMESVLQGVKTRVARKPWMGLPELSVTLDLHPPSRKSVTPVLLVSPVDRTYFARGTCECENGDPSQVSGATWCGFVGLGSSRGDVCRGRP